MTTLLDMRTLIFSMGVTHLLCTAMMLVLWLQHRRRLAGTGLWAVEFALQALAVILMGQRDAITHWVTVVLANAMVLGGIVLGVVGLAQFLGRAMPRWQCAFLALLVAAFTAIHAWFTFGQPDLMARHVNTAVFQLAVAAQGAWLMLAVADAGIRRSARVVATVYLGLGLLCVVRLAFYAAGGEKALDYFDSGAFEQAVVFAYQVLLILMAFGLWMLVNQRLLAQVRTQERKFAHAFQNSPYAVLITRLSDGRVLEANRGFSELTGYTPEEAIGRTSLDLNLWMDGQDRQRVVAQLSAEGRIHGQEHRFRRKSGEPLVGLFSADLIDLAGERCVLSSIDDITQRKAAEEQVRHMAQHDALTGLPNRALFAEHVRQAMAEAHRDGTGFALLVMDLDRFKQVNDTLGHDAGDRMLQAVAQRLSASVRDSDIVARIGGDEFVALLRGVGAPTQAMAAATKVRAVACTPCALGARGEHSVPVSLSIGIALYPLHGTEADALFRLADAAMYRAKFGGAGLPVLHAEPAQGVQD
jgi:diguanylate cyclase (GGDEF)-like protein/PAS domain S-box-containing protein